jgi:thiol-disulfide isomerase/thioredoxin
MIGFVRALRLAALAGGAVAVVFAAGWLDGVLGAAHFLSGLAAGFIMALGGVVAFIAYSHRQATKNLPVRPPPMVAEPVAVYDWAVTALDGSLFRMDQIRGEPFLLNIWSTMCPPCIAELPSIERLHHALSNDGVRVLCVATDSDADRVRRLVAENGWRLPVYVLGKSEIPQVFDSDYIPTTYVVSADGRVVYQHTGAALWDHPRVISFLRRLAIQHVVVPLDAKAGGPGVDVAPSGTARGA